MRELRNKRTMLRGRINRARSWKLQVELELGKIEEEIRLARKEFARADRELAMKDGRYQVCPPKEEPRKKVRKEKKEMSLKEMAGMIESMSSVEQAELIKQLEEMERG